MTGGPLVACLACGVVGAVVFYKGFRSGYLKGLRVGHDRVVVWMLENAAMPDAWEPTREWVDA